MGMSDRDACLVRSDAMGIDESVRTECADWLETVLFPMALRAAKMTPVTPADALATLRRRPDAVSFLEWSKKGYWNAREAEQFCEDLRIVDAALVVAHWAGDVPRARDARDAIVLL